MSCASSPKSRNTTSESLVRYFAIRELLLILSEFNVQYINGSVFEFYTLFIILRMHIKKSYHGRIKKTNSEQIVISEKKQNQKLETLIAITIDAENNETTLAISSD